ncbi:VWA domain-containing protein [Crocosphaera sp. XPORK-15E]|uniref:vWA domain-containing protein n=1 Tax=Crocosphaera sp. XPORK-15E TaxID=3110247 RepID=UPI002B1FFEE0|nr:VWA domain-containing protein [Crocosphaera sp. XPORK-15E]MEA5534069.1 VWA domain-containing protein [Crocosphaera sp. XPORK-15E]
MLDQRDYTLIIDKSGSMSTVDPGKQRSRWDLIQESTLALARKCDSLDSDGITVYVFSGKFRCYENVNVSKVEQIFKENEPVGGTNLTSVLQDALNKFFQRKQNGQAKAGETILVVTDGEPDNRSSVTEIIIDASKRIDADEELGISFIQIGNNLDATKFLKTLDDQLMDVGAKFDIVDTLTFDEMEDLTLTEVLLNAIYD